MLWNTSVLLAAWKCQSLILYSGCKAGKFSLFKSIFFPECSVQLFEWSFIEVFLVLCAAHQITCTYDILWNPWAYQRYIQYFFFEYWSLDHCTLNAFLKIECVLSFQLIQNSILCWHRGSVYLQNVVFCVGVFGETGGFFVLWIIWTVLPSSSGKFSCLSALEPTEY